MGNIRSGEEMAALYRRHVGMVYQICLMLMKNVPDAEDVTQTVFRKVMEYPQPFRDAEHEKAWLIVTATNTCKDMLRRASRQDEALEHHGDRLAAPVSDPAEGDVLSAPMKGSSPTGRAENECLPTF